MNYEQKIKKLEAQIRELKAEQELPPVWKPNHGEEYYAPDDDDVAVSFTWYDDRTDNYLLKVGHLFKTEQEAEDHVRALILIEKIRRERYKAQGHWRPNEQASYTIYWDRFRNRADMHTTNWGFPADVFGLWQDFGALEDVINKYSSELRWYFTEYLPSIN